MIDAAVRVIATMGMRMVVIVEVLVIVGVLVVMRMVVICRNDREVPVA